MFSKGTRMNKELKALEEIKTCKLIDHVKVKEGLFSNKLIGYERRYGKDVFSKQIPIIEKALEERGEFELKYAKTHVALCKSREENSKKGKALKVAKNLFDFDFALRFPNNQPMLKITNKLTNEYWEVPITQEEYDLLKEVLHE